MDWKKFFEPSWPKLFVLLSLFLLSSILAQLAWINAIPGGLYSILHPFSIIFGIFRRLMAISASPMVGQMVINTFAAAFDYAWEYLISCGIVALYSRVKK